MLNYHRIDFLKDLIHCAENQIFWFLLTVNEENEHEMVSYEKSLIGKTLRSYINIMLLELHNHYLDRDFSNEKQKFNNFQKVYTSISIKEPFYNTDLYVRIRYHGK